MGLLPSRLPAPSAEASVPSDRSPSIVRSAENWSLRTISHTSLIMGCSDERLVSTLPKPQDCKKGWTAVSSRSAQKCSNSKRSQGSCLKQEQHSNYCVHNHNTTLSHRMLLNHKQNMLFYFRVSYNTAAKISI